MPASFLTKSLQFLQATSLQTFGGDEFVWWPTERGSNEYVVQIPVVAAVARASAAAVTGLIDIGTDQRELHLTAADFPFPPRENDCFLLGPASGDGPDLEQCRLCTVKDPRTFGPLLKMTAMRQD